MPFATTEETRQPAWWLAGLFMAMLAIGTDEFVFAGVLPDISADLAVSAAAAGQLITAFAVVFALGAPALAVVTDQLPRRTVVVIAQVMFAAANAAAAVAPGYWFLMGARVVAALAASLVASASFVIAAGAAPEGKQGRYLAVVTAGLTVALFTGVPIGTLLGGAYGWRATFWLLAAVGATVALGLRIAAPHIAGSRSAPLAQRLAPLRSGPSNPLQFR